MTMREGREKVHMQHLALLRSGSLEKMIATKVVWVELSMRSFSPRSIYPWRHSAYVFVQSRAGRIDSSNR
jgi:hypothetical protein